MSSGNELNEIFISLEVLGNKAHVINFMLFSRRLFCEFMVKDEINFAAEDGFDIEFFGCLEEVNKAE